VMWFRLIFCRNSDDKCRDARKQVYNMRWGKKGTNPATTDEQILTKP